MTAYRDQYASVFLGGQNVVLLTISPDTPEDLYSWAADLSFPGLFGSDPDGSAYAALGGALRPNTGTPSERTLFVIGPDGIITKVVPDFNEVDPMAYEELKAEIERVTPEPTG